MKKIDEIDKMIAYIKNDHLLTKDCWCYPILEYVNEETGVELWVHNDKQ